MATCRWKPTRKQAYRFEYNYECREAPWRDGAFCIFHAPREEKTREEFEKAVLLKTEREESDESTGFHDFRGYVFPDGFSAFAGASPGGGKNFRKRVDFTHARFGNGASFLHAALGDKAGFFHAAFGDGADFSGAGFGDDAVFLRVRFGDGARFAGARFGNKAVFKFTAFGNGARFEDAAFGDDASFIRASFGDGTVFAGAGFGSEARFSGAAFGGGADFTRAGFGKMARFSGAAFGDGASFLHAAFGDEASFSSAAFLGSALFEGADRDESGGRVFEGSANFRGARFDKPETVLFHKVNFSRALVGDASGLEKISFRDVRWASLPGRRHAIFDEEHREESEPAPVARAYRQLTENYEAAREYRVAGDFHTGAMRMEEDSLRYHWHEPQRGRPWILPELVSACVKFIAYKCYGILSDYGESWLRPLAWLVLLVLVGGVPDYRGLVNQLSSRSFTFPLLAYLHAAALPSLIALLLHALERRFRR
ncbi:MAG: pentapeptide repeat-containing protein [Acidobacteriota bacterium]|nr:MAG: pentapeptide repeat-containing protein [Acidobacteriota bacterium]